MIRSFRLLSPQSQEKRCIFTARTDHLDIALCHDIEFVPMQQIVDETLPALKEVQKQGKVSTLDSVATMKIKSSSTKSMRIVC